jgi:hypothetical protein
MWMAPRALSLDITLNGWHRPEVLRMLHCPINWRDDLQRRWPPAHTIGACHWQHGRWTCRPATSGVSPVGRSTSPGPTAGSTPPRTTTTPAATAGRMLSTRPGGCMRRPPATGFWPRSRLSTARSSRRAVSTTRCATFTSRPRPGGWMCGPSGTPSSPPAASSSPGSGVDASNSWLCRWRRCRSAAGWRARCASSTTRVAGALVLPGCAR